MLFLVLMAEEKCDEEHPCIHGKCLLGKCSCEVYYGGTFCDYCSEQYAGENCSECAEGFVWADEMGTQRCVSPVCVNDDNISCFGHGDCNKKGDAWECRCVRHYDTKSNCKNCSRQHYELESGGVQQCVHKDCLDSTHTIMCSNNGFCTMLEIPLINPAKCHCNTPNMNSMCNACAKGYLEYNHTVDYNGTIVVDYVQCKLNFCGDNADCSGDASRCTYVSSADRYECHCPDNYDFRTFCASCINAYDIATNCTECVSPGYDKKSACTQCVYGYSIESNCTQCLPNYDPATNCTTCTGGHLLVSRCVYCESGFQEDANGVCQTTNKGASAAWITVGIVVGIVAVIAVIAVSIVCARKRNLYKFEKIGTDEDDILMYNVG